MSTYARQASYLADTDDLAHAAGSAVGSSRRAGLDLETYRGLIAATVALGGRPLNAPAWANDRHMTCVVVDLQSNVSARMAECTQLAQVARAALNSEESKARPDQQVIADCRSALAILEPTWERLAYALARLNEVPTDLADTYQPAYALVGSGHVLPYQGRLITGETPA